MPHAWSAVCGGFLLVVSFAGSARPLAVLPADLERARASAPQERPAYPLTIDPLCFSEQATLAPDPPTYDDFGVSASLSGDTALVGAPRDDTLGNNAGVAYVYVRQGTIWTLQQKLFASDGVADSLFGDSVSISGDTALVGAWSNDGVLDQSGAAYVFVRNGSSWTEQAKLLPNDAAMYDHFGRAVSVSGDTALVGTPDDDHSGTATIGSAYVFVRSGTTWTEQAKLVASDGGNSDEFGRSVSLHGDTALVGMYGDDDHGVQSGSAYVFVRNGTSWAQEAKLLPSDVHAQDRFGWSVSVSGNIALVSAHLDDDNGGASGSAYVFERQGSSWTKQAKLLPGEGEAGDRFGLSVAVDGATALVSAPWDDDERGACYVFQSDGIYWTEQPKLQKSNGVPGDRFGWYAALSGDTLLLSEGDYEVNVFVFPPLAGSAYCTCPAGPCGNSDVDAGCTNSTGCGAQLTAYGTTLPDGVTLYASGARPDQTAIFFQGDDAVMNPFGAGFRCAGGSVVRITSPPIQIDNHGTATFGICAGGESISNITGVVPGSGDVKRYQFWYRDPGGPCGASFNLSNGYEIIW